MKRRFKVTVNGETYDVEVEEVGTGRVVEVVKPDSTPQPRTIAAPLSVAPKTREPPEGTIVAPMPGVITEVRVEESESVKSGSVLLVLEAMKMENEIYSQRDGVVTKVHVEVGQQVGRGDPLISFS